MQSGFHILWNEERKKCNEKSKGAAKISLNKTRDLDDSTIQPSSGKFFCSGESEVPEKNSDATEARFNMPP